MSKLPLKIPQNHSEEIWEAPLWEVNGNWANGGSSRFTAISHFRLPPGHTLIVSGIASRKYLSLNIPVSPALFLSNPFKQKDLVGNKDNPCSLPLECKLHWNVGLVHLPFGTSTVPDTHQAPGKYLHKEWLKGFVNPSTSVPGNILERLWWILNPTGLVQRISPSYYFENSKDNRDVPLICFLQNLIYFLIEGLRL